MKKWSSYFSGLPIKWKITIWSSAFMFILFFSYLVLQYMIIEHRSLNYEKQNINRQLEEMLVIIESNNQPLTIEEIKKSENDFSRINDEDQLTRIIDEKGNIVLSVSDGYPETEIIPLPVKSKKFEIVRNSEDPLLILRAPIVTDEFVGTVEIIRSMEMFDDFIDNIFFVLVAAGLGGLLLSFLGGTFLSRQLLSNVRVMTDTMQKIKVNGLEERVPVYETNDEIAQLGKLFNELMDDLEESFTQQKQFVEDASHELRTPLAIIHGHLSLLNRWGKDDPEVLNKSLQSSLKEVERLIQLVQELLELSRAETGTTGPSEVRQVQADHLIQSVKRNFELLHPDYVFTVHMQGDTPYVSIPSRYLEQVLIILLDNAVKFSTNKKEIIITCTSEKQIMRIQVIDKGIGIPKQDIPYVLNRFYRVDKARSRKQGGLGLGLAIAKRWVEKYNGTISIQSKEGEGTTFTITFPAALL
ncbi:HAMP domain-containing sensor histidine kinase [Domibacillus epiphyticus]|uniref:Signal transduction histidine-protein kinase ArlS n=1 Tax=Domibacillus epiphyticus TaxID=1714355 RepID=A0A1V2ABG4_9BACI|nr:HAMP domain-containing histidine kinase [Domibacillus epiphyticus]OMP68338.1 two-component sensor histidine kinase [Domibacillus epiphyticus]